MIISIRNANKNDVEVIAQNIVSVACETTQENLDYDNIKQGINNLLTKPEFGFYIVAEIDNKVVGSLLITYEWSDWRNGVYWWIHSVYVSPYHRNNKIYTQMYSYIKEQAKKLPEVKALRLNVENNNKTARAAYEKLGMKEGSVVSYYDRL